MKVEPQLGRAQGPGRLAWRQSRRAERPAVSPHQAQRPGTFVWWGPTLHGRAMPRWTPPRPVRGPHLQYDLQLSLDTSFTARTAALDPAGRHFKRFRSSVAPDKRGICRLEVPSRRLRPIRGLRKPLLQGPPRGAGSPHVGGALPVRHCAHLASVYPAYTVLNVPPSRGTAPYNKTSCGAGSGAVQRASVSRQTSAATQPAIPVMVASHHGLRRTAPFRSVPAPEAVGACAAYISSRPRRWCLAHAVSPRAWWEPRQFAPSVGSVVTGKRHPAGFSDQRWLGFQTTSYDSDQSDDAVDHQSGLDGGVQWSVLLLRALPPRLAVGTNVFGTPCRRRRPQRRISLGVVVTRFKSPTTFGDPRFLTSPPFGSGQPSGERLSPAWRVVKTTFRFDRPS